LYIEIKMGRKSFGKHDGHNRENMHNIQVANSTPTQHVNIRKK